MHLDIWVLPMPFRSQAHQTVSKGYTDLRKKSTPYVTQLGMKFVVIKIRQSQ